MSVDLIEVGLSESGDAGPRVAETAAWPAPRREGRPGKRLIPGIPICAFTGGNGVGKTLLAVRECMFDLKAGRPVYSTVPIGSRWGHSEPIRSYRMLADLHDCTVLLDEVSIIFRASSGTVPLPEEVITFLHTLRHRGITVRWTAPSWLVSHIDLRRVTQAVVAVHGIGKVAWSDAFWPRPVIIGTAVLDTVGLKFDATPDDIKRRRVYVPKRLMAWGCFDTHADTAPIGRQGVGGVCIDCGGVKPREKCSPERHELLGLSLPGPLERDAPRAPLVPLEVDSSPVADLPLPESLRDPVGDSETVRDRSPLPCRPWPSSTL